MERGIDADMTGFGEVAVNYSDRVNCNWFYQNISLHLPGKIRPAISSCICARIEDQRFHNGHQHDQGYGPGEQLVGLQITAGYKNGVADAIWAPSSSAIMVILKDEATLREKPAIKPFSNPGRYSEVIRTLRSPVYCSHLQQLPVYGMYPFYRVEIHYGVTSSAVTKIT